MSLDEPVYQLTYLAHSTLRELTTDSGALGVAGNRNVGGRTRTPPVDAQGATFAVDRTSAPDLIDVP
jgi:hypothetical protein